MNHFEWIAYFIEQANPIFYKILPPAVFPVFLLEAAVT